MIRTVASKEFRELMRDGRIKWSAAIIAVMLIAAFATAAQRYADISVERESAQEIVREQWLEQGEKNPHAAAHYGIYAFKPVTPLAFFDTGVSSFTGVSIWIEAHNQNDAEGAPARDETAVARFGELTAAFTLQLLLPLLVILLAFPAFSGEREVGTLRQVLSMGVRPRDLLFGKALGATQALALFLGPILLIGLVGLVLLPGGAAFLPHGLLLVLVYSVYALIFLFLTLAVSAASGSSKTTLVIMVGVWAVSSFVLPRIAADTSQVLYPTPSSYEFEQAIANDLENGLDGVSPAAVIRQRQEQTLALYNVESLDELPINFQGIIFDIQEDLGDQVFDKHYGALHETFEKQTGVFSFFSLFSPRLAVQLASMELSGTSLLHHLRFSRAAESYRRELIDQMNQAITFNSAGNQTDYRAGPELWEDVEPFEYEIPPLSESAAELGPSGIVMFLWLTFSIVAGIVAVDRLRVMSGA